MRKFSPEVTPARRWLALFVAIVADIVQAPIDLVPILGTPLDVVVALVLSLIVGIRTPIALAFVLELIPGVGGLPTWSACVGLWCMPPSYRWIRSRLPAS